MTRCLLGPQTSESPPLRKSFEAVVAARNRYTAALGEPFGRTACGASERTAESYLADVGGTYSAYHKERRTFLQDYYAATSDGLKA